MNKKNPFIRDIIMRCIICEKIIMVDQNGCGRCEQCNWAQGNNDEESEDKYKISYPDLVPLSKARQQYKEGKPFTPSFEDFVNGLIFYSEMEFIYNEKDYGVFYYTNSLIEFFEDQIPESIQNYKSIEEFDAKANIDGRLLKDMWDEVTNAQFMECRLREEK